MRFMSYASFVLVAVSTLLGCTTTSAIVPVTAISIEAGTPSSGSVSSGVWTPAAPYTTPQTLQLSAVISPANATAKTVVWSSSDTTGKITVSSTGFVTASGPAGALGEIVITAAATDFTGTIGTFEVNVNGWDS